MLVHSTNNLAKISPQITALRQVIKGQDKVLEAMIDHASNLFDECKIPPKDKSDRMRPWEQIETLLTWLWACSSELHQVMPREYQYGLDYVSEDPVMRGVQRQAKRQLNLAASVAVRWLDDSRLKGDRYLAERAQEIVQNMLLLHQSWSRNKSFEHPDYHRWLALSVRTKTRLAELWTQSAREDETAAKSMTKHLRVKAVLPATITSGQTWDDLKRIGFKVSPKQPDPASRSVQLPHGWTLEVNESKPADVRVLDHRGCVRATALCASDVYAPHLNFVCRYQVMEVNGPEGERTIKYQVVDHATKKVIFETAPVSVPAVGQRREAESWIEKLYPNWHDPMARWD